MTESTTTINACDASLWLDNAAGTLTDISGSSNNLTMAITNGVGDRRVFGSKGPIRKVCGQDVQFDIVVLYSTAEDEGLDLLRDWALGANYKDARSFVLYLPDKNVGSDKYSCEVVQESLSIPADPGEPAAIEVSATLLITGELSYTKAAT